MAGHCHRHIRQPLAAGWPRAIVAAALLAVMAKEHNNTTIQPRSRLAYRLPFTPLGAYQFGRHSPAGVSSSFTGRILVWLAMPPCHYAPPMFIADRPPGGHASHAYVDTRRQYTPRCRHTEYGHASLAAWFHATPPRRFVYCFAHTATYVAAASISVTPERCLLITPRHDTPPDTPCHTHIDCRAAKATLAV